MAVRGRPLLKCSLFVLGWRSCRFSREVTLERSLRIPGSASHFFALLPDAAAAAAADRKAHALRSWLGLSGRPRGTGKYHVSLWGWPAREGPGADGIRLMRSVAERISQAPFKVSFDEVATFAQGAERRALVMTGGDGVIGAARLHESLDRDIRAHGLRGGRSSCWPHMTLLYDRWRTEPFSVRPLSWRVTDFVLVRSVPREPHVVLGRWTLAGS